MQEHVSVTEMFWSIQGEGLLTGLPMRFLRLAGCNADEGFRCWSWCDTKYARGGGEEMKPETAYIRLAALPYARWVCITGGEPLLQARALRPLVEMLLESGHEIQVQTNGTLPPLAYPIHYSVSPKRLECNARIVQQADELKFVIAGEKKEEELFILEFLARYRVMDKPIILQPVDNRPEAVETCLHLVKEHVEWRVMLQQHKVMGIR